ncbi:DEAD/DEAH box helicase [Alishewanella agri BL06]|uniref:DEAD/DEAH box helicase n=1 Tax=Alishewanella agri BL06 TaxID=1195246 RepID=I9DTU2_9ALTE|nr:DEAD/DEAH box helicase [Alishewanella agri BL06]
MQFSALNLAPDLLRGLTACGFSELTPVQAQAIVPARRGKDLQVTAQTILIQRDLFLNPFCNQI